MQRRLLLSAAAAALAGCASNGPEPGDRRREVEVAVDHALSDLFVNDRGARDLANRAQAMLIFPTVLSAGLVVGGSFGEGALRKQHATLGYYRLSGASLGFLAGAQTRAIYVFFMTREALAQFQASDGWTAGADAAIAVIGAGAEARADLRTASEASVIGMVRGQQGFMANLSLDGTKFTRFKL